MKKDIFTITEFACFLRLYPHVLDSILGQEWIADYSFSNHLAIRIADSGCRTGLEAKYYKATNEILEGN